MEHGSRFHGRIVFKGRHYYLGGFGSAEQASAAYNGALVRLFRGEPALLIKPQKPSAGDIERWYQPPHQGVKFGDCEGEAVVPVALDQEQSVLISHHALNKLHPKVQKFILFASNTGDLAEAAEASGLTEEQVATVLPRLRMFLGSLVERPIL
jgi:hypothetical protein